MGAEHRPRRRTLLASTGAGALVLGAGACARIPQDSAISSAPVDGATDPGAPYVRPRGPQAGATPSQIVAGFVQAGVGEDQDFAVAREYLAPAGRADWDPTDSITIYSGDDEFTTTAAGSGVVRLSLQAVGQIDASGVRTLLASPSARDIDVPLTQVDGQWRISRAPAGIFLSQASFEILFTAGRLYFLGARERHLVPDVRWVRAQDAATSLLRLLTAGPAPNLTAAVHSAVPSQLSLAEVTISSRHGDAAQVNLPEQVAAMPAARRSLLIEQVLATVQSLPYVGEVTMAAGSTELAADSSLDLALPRSPSRLIGAADQGVIEISGSTADETQLVPAWQSRRVRSPVIGMSTPRAAALDADGRRVLIAPGRDAESTDRAREVEVGKDALAPSIDDSERVWSAEHSTAGRLLALDAAGEADVTVEVSWLVGRTPRVLALASDSTRLIIVSRGQDSDRVDFCAVVRDNDGTPRSVTDPEPVSVPLATISHLSWYDEVTLLVLGADLQGSVRALSLDATGQIEQLPDPPRGTAALAGSAAREAVWAADADGHLHRRDAGVWTALDVVARDPACC